MNNLKNIREAKGLTLAQLAEKSGVDAATLKEIEDGYEVELTSAEAQRIVGALVAKFSDLFTM